MSSHEKHLGPEARARAASPNGPPIWSDLGVVSAKKAKKLTPQQVELARKHGIRINPDRLPEKSPAL